MTVQHLLSSYKSYLQNPESPASLHRKLVNDAQTLLAEDQPRKVLDKFFIDVLIANVKSVKFDIEKALLALSYLEVYAALLYRYPWKTEYWTIKHHCGFYRTMLDPCLLGVDKILEKFGYRSIAGQCFRLVPKPLDSVSLLKMGAQCLLAHSEFKIIRRACDSAQSMDYETALLKHLESGGTSKELSEKLRALPEPESQELELGSELALGLEQEFFQESQGSQEQEESPPQSLSSSMYSSNSNNSSSSSNNNSCSNDGRGGGGVGVDGGFGGGVIFNGGG
ncbi:uncharacterized protein LOC115223998, partial [Argonauta hians]